MLNKAVRLGVIAALTALLLALVNYYTEPVIKTRRNLALESALTVLAGGGKPGAAEENPAPSVTKRWPIDSGGWILEITAMGYGGPMTLVASYSSDGAIMAARLLDNTETVGFGKKAEDPAYMSLFSGMGGDTPIPHSTSDLETGADIVAGATITFSGISQALKIGSNLVKDWGD